MSAEEKNRVLIIDDDPMNVLILEEILSKKYDLLNTPTAEDAFVQTESFKPDLILLNIMMQNSDDGYDICRRLKSNPAMKFTKIILISSKALLKDRLIGYGAGADDYLSKPFDPEELLAKVRVFIRLKSVEEIDQAKDDLINLFSHETRTPLNAIIGFSKLLQDSPSLSGDEKEFAKLIADSGESLLSLSNKAILLSNLKKKSHVLDETVLRLRAVADKAAKAAKARFPDKNVGFENKCKDVKVVVDEMLLDTALLHLLDNAFKFSPDGSVVEVVSSVESKTGNLLLKVRDSGCGISPDRLGSIFYEFGVADVSHHGRGHGLSLAVVKVIMETYRGSISVANNSDGPGCAFTLSFPASVLKKKKD